MGAAALAAFLLPRYNANHMPTAAKTENGAVPAALMAGQAQLAEPASPAAAVMVYVCGAVKKPGVYRLQASARIINAIEHAGSASADADLDQLNLAEPVSDGMKITVPRKGQTLAPSADISQASSASAREGSVPGQPALSHRTRSRGGSSHHKLQSGQTLNVNTASEQELTALPGVGPGIARRIVEYRTANGPFATVDDLQNVSGIGPSKFDKMAPYVRL